MAIYNTEANPQHTDDNPLGLGLESYNSKPQQKLPDHSKVQFQNFAGAVPVPYQGIYDTGDNQQQTDVNRYPHNLAVADPLGLGVTATNMGAPHRFDAMITTFPMNGPHMNLIAPAEPSCLPSGGVLMPTAPQMTLLQQVQHANGITECKLKFDPKDQLIASQMAPKKILPQEALTHWKFQKYVPKISPRAPYQP